MSNDGYAAARALARASLALILATFAWPASAAAASEPIPLSDFARLPSYEEVKISPSGSYIAATISNDDDEESLVFMDMKTQEVVTVIKGRKKERITSFFWANDERVVLWLGRKYGALDAPAPTDNLIAVNWDGKKREWLMGRAKDGNFFDRSFKVAQLVHRLPEDKKHILVAVNNFAARSGSFTEVFKLNIYNGSKRKLETAPMRDAQIVADNAGNIRLAIGSDAYNENAMVVHEMRDGEWHKTGEYLSKEGTVRPVGFTPDNTLLYVLDNRTTDTDGLYLYNLQSKEQELVYAHEYVDIDDVEIAPDGDLLGLHIEPDYPEFVWLNRDHELSEPLEQVQQALRGYRVRPTSITQDGRLAIIRASSDRLIGRYFLFDTVDKKLSAITSVTPWLDETQLSPVDPYVLTVRDGTKLYAYLTRPKNKENGPYPLVVMPHGGPHGVRDFWGYDSYAQVMASRGYAVLQVNFRGSGGYGREFLHIGFGKWGTLMQDDLTDATNWAIDAGLAEADRVCIFGGSYGGYAAMMGAVREPDLYQCVIAYVGVYDLELMFEKGDIPRRRSGLVYLKQAVGEDEADLRARSPVHNLQRLKAPVFIVHGGEDFRVDVEHAHRLRKGLEELGKPYEWMVKPREGHGFYRPENREELFQRMLTFLDKYIGSERMAAAD